MSVRSMILACSLSALALSGCAPQRTQILSESNDRSGRGMGLDSRDFAAAAQAAVQKLLTSGSLDRPDGGRYVIAISRVTNDTMQRIDTDMLIKKIRVAVLNSGKAAITTAVGENGPEDDLAMQTRDLRNSAEFNQHSVARRHEMMAPDYSLSGKIIQEDATVDNGQRVDYSFQLTLTDVHSGVAAWEDEEPLSKLGPAAAVAW